MKITGSRVIVLGLSFLIMGPFWWAAEGLRDLGLSEDEARMNVSSALEYGYVPLQPAAKAFMTADGATRATLARAALEWAKAYTGTSAFRSTWAGIRDSHKPSEPTDEGSVDDEMQRQRAEQKAQIEEMKKAAKDMPADQRKEFEAMIEEVAAQMEAMAEDPEMQGMMKQGLEMQREGEKQSYEEALRKWNEDFPENPNPIIARRLREFLDVCGDVDFDAKLVAKNGKMIFADPKLEQKPSDWKLCYRAGRETVESARGFAEKWLSELE